MNDLTSKQVSISEEKMQIVINNYFKSECNVDTSIRQAFEKGFRIGVKKGLTAQQDCSDCIKHGGDWDCDYVHCHKGKSAQPERPKGEWVLITDNRGQHFECKKCGEWRYHVGQKFCGNCGADMRGEEDVEVR